MPFDFKKQHDYDLHIALEVGALVIPQMMAKVKAQGIETRGVSDYGFVDSIYFLCPNGYGLKLCAKRAGHDAAMDVAANGALAKLQRWTAARAVGLARVDRPGARMRRPRTCLLVRSACPT